jgi:hypothetical protein
LAVHQLILQEIAQHTCFGCTWNTKEAPTLTNCPLLPCDMCCCGGSCQCCTAAASQACLQAAYSLGQMPAGQVHWQPQLQPVGQPCERSNEATWSPAGY